VKLKHCYRIPSFRDLLQGDRFVYLKHIHICGCLGMGLGN